MDAQMSVTDYQQAYSHAVAFDHSQHGKIEVAGRDAATFLHNLCTNDIINLQPGAGCQAYFANAQARLVSPIIVYRVPGRNEFWLDIPVNMAAKVMTHLDRYLISEDVQLADHTAEFAQIHVAGPESPVAITKCADRQMPDLAELQHIKVSDNIAAMLVVRRRSPLGLPGFDILCAHDRTDTVWQRLAAAGAPRGTDETYEVLRIEAGTPEFGRDIDENRLVFDIGRNPAAISYTKGCYLGQEPIVMARDRGHANRKLLGLIVSSPDLVPPGAKVFRGDVEVGQVTSSVASPRLGRIALAYLRRGHQDPGTAVEIEVNGSRRTAEVSSLPFSGASV
jgi:folate-binding protein YgfZ